MAIRKLKDDEGNVHEVEFPDDDGDEDESEDDPDTIFLDEEDIEWLRRKRREEAEASRTSGTTKKQTKTGSSGKVVKIRAKQQSTGSRSQTTSRKRTLRLA